MLADIKAMIAESEAHGYNLVDGLSEEELLWLVKQAEALEKIIETWAVLKPSEVRS